MSESSIDLVLLFAASLTLVWAAVSDVGRFTIPNAAVLALAALFLPYALIALTPAMIFAHAGVALAAFAVGASLFAAKVMGGGDVKLIAAVGLWAGPSLALQSLLVMAIAGGGLALALLAVGAVRVRLSIAGLATPGPALKSQPLPYGVAIAVAGWWTLYTLTAV
jgi:prepilin peptidase CpaA